MGLARSTFYDETSTPQSLSEARRVDALDEIAAEWAVPALGRDSTYIAIATGIVYLAAMLDAWSRRVVSYAIGRRVDARLALATLKAVVISRAPPHGCIHHSDRGCQYVSED